MTNQNLKKKKTIKNKRKNLKKEKKTKETNITGINKPK